MTWLCQFFSLVVTSDWLATGRHLIPETPVGALTGEVITAPVEAIVRAVPHGASPQLLSFVPFLSRP